MSPYGGTGKKQRKTGRLSIKAKVIAVTLDKQWGMILKKVEDGSRLFISLDEYHRRTTMIRLYLPEDDIVKEAHPQLSPRECLIATQPYMYVNFRSLNFDPFTRVNIVLTAW